MRNQGTRETTGQVDASCVSYLKHHDFEQVRYYINDLWTYVEATIWRIRETIRVGELAMMHRLGQMSRLLMHEKRKTWKREFSFDHIETAAEMNEALSCISTNPVPDPFFYRNMVIPKHPHTPAEFTLEMKVDVE